MNDLILVKNLKRGDQHGQVKLIQEWLCLHKEIVGTDGDFGPATERAVKDFQS
ncbi:MAG: peptidoglycan-binding protein, partial [Methylococcaceae bacterium]|nr:peptidoglycan-binding protein [Methylococcaceae bacterium]